MMEFDPSLALQGAMVARIKADSKLAALGLSGRVFDRVEQNTAFPFVKVGEDLVAPDDSECGSSTELISTVRVYSRKPGRVEAKQYAERLRFLLTKQTGFAVPGWQVVLGYCESYRIEEHADGLTHQAVLEFRYRINPKGKLATGRSILAAPIVRAAAKLKIKAAAAMAITPRVSGSSKLRLLASAAIVLPAIIASGSATIFSPEMMFGAGETGAVYDPSDLTSLYQGRTGLGGVVTAGGQTAGIMLDKSKMGGKSAAQFIADQPELNVGAWTLSNPGTATATESPPGTFNLTGDGVNSGVADKQITTVAGTWYRVQFDIGTAAVFLRVGTAQTGSQLFAAASYNVGAQTAFFLATGAASWLRFNRSVASLGTVSGVSVKAVPGFHSIAPSDSARPLYGREPVTGRRNLLTYTEQFDNAAWVKTNCTVTADASASFDGSSTADLVKATAVGSNQGYINQIVAGAGPFGNYVGSYYLKQDNSSGARIQINANWDSANHGAVFTFDFATQSVATSTYGSKISILGAVAESVGSGWFRLIVRINTFGTTPPGSLNAWVYPYLPGDAVNSGAYYGGAQFEAGAVATAYQKVGHALDVTEAGVASRHFLQPDGVDDWLQVLPAADLGAVWSHVGGWRANSALKYLFATRNNYETAISRGNTDQFDTWNSAGARAALASGAASIESVLTVEQTSFTSISGRVNGAGSVGPITMSDRSANTAGLALFASQNTSPSGGGFLSGRFFGGVWINRALTTAERAANERYYTHKAGLAA